MSDEAFYEAEVERVVGGCGHAVAVAVLAQPVGTVFATGTLDEADLRLDGRDDITALQCCEGSRLEL